MAAQISVHDSPEWLAYEHSPEFQAFLAGKLARETAHEKHVNAAHEERAQARHELIEAEKEKTRLLEIYRVTPEHLAAVGWGGPKAPKPKRSGVTASR